MVVAMALDAAGVEREAIVADYLASSERIELIMDRLLASDTYRRDLEGHDPQQHAPIPGTIERFFEIVEDRFDGSVPWLLESGLEPYDLERLRVRLAPLAGSGENGAVARGGRTASSLASSVRSSPTSADSLSCSSSIPRQRW